MNDMKKIVLWFALVFIVAALAARAVDIAKVQEVAESFVSVHCSLSQTGEMRVLQRNGTDLGYVFKLAPSGYVVVCADDDLPPVIAWSETSSFSAEDSDLLAELLTEDISSRLQYLDDSARGQNRLQWQNLSVPKDPFQQWPPEGTTATGGWLKTNWTQNAPYNAMCPMDNVTNQRSISGCPAVAMAQIVNYQRTINGTNFSDTDDYHHTYAGRNYWIDEDAMTLDFPSWTELNGYLGEMMQHYKYNEEQTDADKAALTWACGVAAHQVYTSSGSGTFGVAQAMTAYQRFGFPEVELLTNDTPETYNQLAQNMKDAKPAHLAVVTPAWDAGHNVVVDGYNTDNFFHLNFGWGGSYNGWYLLPSQMPYNLTVLEGLIVDITPKHYLFTIPDTLDFTDPSTALEPHTLEILNISEVQLVIEAVSIIPQIVGDAMLVMYPDAPFLPYNLGVGQSLNIILQWSIPVNQPRELLQGNVIITHSFGVSGVPMRLDSALLTSEVSDEYVPSEEGFYTYPNPFSSRLTISLKENISHAVTIYNLKGQKVRELNGEAELVWDGKDEHGISQPNGIYLIRSKEAGLNLGKGVILLK
jgi:hypothetical protein